MLAWIKRNEFTVNDVRFRLPPIERALERGVSGDPKLDNPFLRSSRNSFLLLKPKWMVTHYARLVRRLEPRTIFELGIYRGGSTAFLAHLARPDKLVAVDLNDKPVSILEEHIEEHGLREVVRTFYGVDQADSERLTEIVDTELAGQPLDLVVDDASHFVDQTRRSFNALFPRLRPGGAYVIEDWSWAHIAGPGLWPGKTPMTQLILELVLACGSSPELVAKLDIRYGLARVTRGPGDIDPTGFDISSCYHDRVGALMTGWSDRQVGRSG